MKSERAAPIVTAADTQATQGASITLVDSEDSTAGSPDDRHFHVAHSMPGRVRLRVPLFRSSSDYELRFLSGVQNIGGVLSVRTNRLSASAVITYDVDVLCETHLLERVQAVDVSAFEPAIREEAPRSVIAGAISQFLLTFERATPPVVQLIASGASLVAALFGSPLTIPLALLSGLPILSRATGTAVRERRISVDGLDGMAALLMVLHAQYRAATFMMTLIAFGEYIRELTAKNCQKIVDDLLGMAGCSAWLVKGKKRICIPAEQVKEGDQVVVYPGDLIPIDGIVIRGEGLVNQASMTGESRPVEVQSGDSVLAATILMQGQIYVTCTSVLTSSKAHQVIDLVNAAPLSETKIQNYAAVMADKAVMPIISAAFLSFAVTRDPTRLMSMMIYDFSTGIRISAPTAVLASMARAGKLGILIKSGGALERLSRVNAIVFDKTGTLTSGNPHVTRVEAIGQFTSDELVAMAAAVENRLSHPAAQAIVSYAVKRKLTIPTRSGASHSVGMGVAATVGGRRVLLGSRRLMEHRGIDLSAEAGSDKLNNQVGESVVHVAVDNVLAGCIWYTDTIREEAAATVRRLHKRGVRKVVMATGDIESSARRIADELHLDEVVSSAFPENKAALVKDLKAKGYVVAVVGDGINDSPALAHADVAISLRSATAAAREHADVVLMDDDLSRLADGIDIARGAMGLIKETMALVAVANGAGLALTGIGLVGPAGATLLNNGSAIVAALNSLRPLAARSWSKDRTTPLAGNSF